MSNIVPPLVPRSATGTPPSRGLVITALVLSIVGLAVPLFAIVGLILGIVALVRMSRSAAPRRGMALSAIIFGAIGFFTSSIIVLIPAVHGVRIAAQNVQCKSNLKQISMGLIMYSNENHGWLPPDLATLRSKPYGGDSRLFICPADSSAKPSFQYLGAGERYSTRTQNKILIYEPMKNHSRGFNALFADMGVQWIPDPQAAQVIRELESGQNPPPSLHAR